MTFIQDDQVIEAFTADRADQPFTIRICLCRQVRRVRRVRHELSLSRIRSILAMASGSPW